MKKPFKYKKEIQISVCYSSYCRNNSSSYLHKWNYSSMGSADNVRPDAGSGRTG